MQITVSGNKDTYCTLNDMPFCTLSFFILSLQVNIKKTKMEHTPVILSIAGSDCSGGEGIKADIKTISALGGYAASAITAVTVQNTLGVCAVQAMSPEIVRGQIEAVMEDLQPVAIKIGMVSDIQIVHVISDCLRKYAPEYVVYDPVMVSTSGRKLMTDEAIEEIKKECMAMPHLSIYTDNAMAAFKVMKEDFPQYKAKVASDDKLVVDGFSGGIKINDFRIVIKSLIEKNIEKSFIEKNIEIREVKIEHASIEDLYLAIMSREG